jgi:hypothetical protein
VLFFFCACEDAAASLEIDVSASELFETTAPMEVFAAGIAAQKTCTPTTVLQQTHGSPYSRRRLKQIAVSDREELERLTQFPSSLALRMSTNDWNGRTCRIGYP